jgi:hypothetical protein
LSTLYYVQKEVLLAERCQSFWCRSSSAWLERSTHNRKVAGSNPVSGTHTIYLNWDDDRLSRYDSSSSPEVENTANLCGAFGGI